MLGIYADVLVLGSDYFVKISPALLSVASLSYLLKFPKTNACHWKNFSLLIEDLSSCLSFRLRSYEQELHGWIRSSIRVKTMPGSVNRNLKQRQKCPVRMTFHEKTLKLFHPTGSFWSHLFRAARCQISD